MAVASRMDELLKKYGQSDNSNAGYSEKVYNRSVMNSLLEKYSVENTNRRIHEVSSWANQYNKFYQNLSGYKGGWISPDQRQAISEQADYLISGFEGIKGYAGRFGLSNAKDYLKQIQQMQREF